MDGWNLTEVRQRISALTMIFGLLCAQSTLAESIGMISDGGTYGVPVAINGQLTLTFTIDSGASDVTIPGDVARTLLRSGALKRSDFVGQRTYTLADGTEMPSALIRIRSLRVGSTELHDVIAAIGPADASLLLGQSFLKRLKSWSIDNGRHLFVINETAGTEGGGVVTTNKFADDPFLGTWILDRAKSIVNQRQSEAFVPGPRRASRTFRDTPQGLEGTANWIDAYGVEPHELTARVDGRDYPWGAANTTLAMTRIGRRTIEGVVKVGGRVAAIATAEVSEDGTRLTIESKRPEDGSGFYTHEEYEKQDQGDEFANARAAKPSPPASIPRLPTAAN
jgi:clan AA aspartic protease (TIGR02281 family)